MRALRLNCGHSILREAKGTALRRDVPARVSTGAQGGRSYYSNCGFKQRCRDIRQGELISEAFFAMDRDEINLLLRINPRWNFVR